MNSAIIASNIQRMCFHDGPGIRTTVFLKGCNLHCPWCSNPENINFFQEEYCIDGKTGTYGREYSGEELLNIILKDQLFWQEDGGVTFSGGEALLQAAALESVFMALQEKGIHMAVESAMFIPEDCLDIALKYIDYFIIDTKILDEELCRKTLGGDIILYLSNVEKVYRAGKKIVFRVPCNYEYTFTEKNKKDVRNFLMKYKEAEVQLFAIHDLGRSKYESLGIKFWEHREVEAVDLQKYCEELIYSGISAEVIQL